MWNGFVNEQEIYKLNVLKAGGPHPPQKKEEGRKEELILYV